MNVTVENMNIYYESVGSGEPILFLHGWGSSCDAFRRMILPLQTDFRCISLDLPGFGKSDTPQNPLDLSDYCRIVKEFIDELGLCDPIMIGHSNGGRITLNMCAAGMVNPKKIVLFGAAGIPIKKTFRQKARQRSFKIIKGILTLPIVRNYTENLLNDARKHFGSADYNSAPPVMRQTLVKLINEDITDRLHNIKAETLLVWGEKDTATPLYTAKIMEREIKGSGLCVLEGLTHWCFIEDPNRVDAILNCFLRGN